MTSSLREDIERTAVTVERVVVPEWNGRAVYVRRMSIDDFDRFVEEVDGCTKFQGIRLLCQLSMCDADGERLYGDSDEDRLAVGRLDPAALAAVADGSSKINTITDDKVEDAKKNSEPTD